MYNEIKDDENNADNYPKQQTNTLKGKPKLKGNNLCSFKR